MENQEEKDAMQEQFRMLNQKINNLYAFIFLTFSVSFMTFSGATPNLTSILGVVAGLAWVLFIVMALIGSGIFESTQASQKKKDNSEN